MVVDSLALITAQPGATALAAHAAHGLTRAAGPAEVRADRFGLRVDIPARAVETGQPVECRLPGDPASS